MIWSDLHRLCINKAQIMTFLTAYNPCPYGHAPFNMSGELSCVKVNVHVRLKCEQALSACVDGMLLVNQPDSTPFQIELRKTLSRYKYRDWFFWTGLENKGKKINNGSSACIFIDGDAKVIKLYKNITSAAALPFVCQSRKTLNQDKPDLKIDDFYHDGQGFLYLGHTAEIRCHANNSIWGHISWKLSNNSIVSDIRVTSSQDVIMEIIDGTPRDRGRSISILSFVPKFLASGKVTCAYYTRRLPREVWEKCDPKDGVHCVTKDFETECKHKPRMSIKYHTSDNQIHLGRAFTAVCAADFNTTGHLLWIMYFGGTEERLNSEDDPRVKSFEGESPCNGTIRLTITLSFTMTMDYALFRLICSSYLEVEGDVMDAAENIQMEYGPQAPTMSLNRTEFDEGELFNAQCRACVGNRGNLSWEVLDLAGHPAPQTFLNSIIVDENVTTEHDVTYCGIDVTSRLTLKVLKTLEGTRLRCSSFPGRYLKGFPVTATSSVIIIRGDTSNNLLNYIDMIPILLVIFIFVAFICYRFCSNDEREENDQMENLRKFQNRRKKKKHQRQPRKGKKNIRKHGHQRKRPEPNKVNAKKKPTPLSLHRMNKAKPPPPRRLSIHRGAAKNIPPITTRKRPGMKAKESYDRQMLRLQSADALRRS